MSGFTCTHLRVPVVLCDTSCVDLCNHCYTQDTELFHLHRDSFCYHPSVVHYLSPAPSNPRQPLICSPSLESV